MSIDITGLDKVKLVQALYNRAQPIGLGRMHFVPGPLSDEEAAGLVLQGYLDYVKGRVMKVRVNEDYLVEGLYDRDNGAGAAQEAVDTVLEEMTQP